MAAGTPQQPQQPGTPRRGNGDNTAPPSSTTTTPTSSSSLAQPTSASNPATNTPSASSGSAFSTRTADSRSSGNKHAVQAQQQASSDPASGLPSSHSQQASLSTTPTQSHIYGTVTQRAANAGRLPSNSAATQRESILTWSEGEHGAGSAAGTIGKGQPPRNLAAPTPGRTPSRQAREPSQAARSTSYAPSDIDNFSGLSASEYSSGEDDERLSTSMYAPRGRGTDSRPSMTDRSASARGPPATTSSSSNAGRSTQATGKRRGSAAAGASLTREESRARRASVIPRETGGYEDDEEPELVDEDDEVQPYDRGEELVRRRAKARAKEKALRKKEKEKERERQRMALSPGPRPGGGSGGDARPTSPKPSGQLDREGRPTFISMPSSSGTDGGLLSPSTAAGTPLSPGATANKASLNYPSPHSHIRRPGATSSAATPSQTQQSSGRRYSSLSGQSTSTVAAVPSGGGAAPSRAVSGYAPPQPQPQPQGSYDAPTTPGRDVFYDGAERAGLTAAAAAESVAGASSVAGSVADLGADEIDEERDTVVGLAGEPRQHDGDDDDGTNGENQEEGGEDGDETPDAGEDGSGSDGDVEYTLKDRQDAINIEHPFGLPIWKPALYKKSRTVTRNAEDALHSMPSAAAERHLLPGNLLWTLLFGSWLCALCLVLGLALCLIPLGGRRYGRVLWELGWYLFWPFGKYVEVEVGPDSGERGAELPGAEAQAGGGLDETYESYENAFTPVAARFPHDHSHQIPFNSRASPRPSSVAAAAANIETPEGQQAESSSSGSSSHGGRTARNASEGDGGGEAAIADRQEDSPLRSKSKPTTSYGAIPEHKESRVEEEASIYEYVHDDEGHDVGRAKRVAGLVAFSAVYWLLVAPLMGLVCLACWGMVFTIPMAKLTWVLLKNLSTQPLALHFHSARGVEGEAAAAAASEHTVLEGSGGPKTLQALLRPLAPSQDSPKAKSTRDGGLVRRSRILLCTYRAMGAQYYKYTVGGVNILFINTLPFVFFTIFDFFFVETYVHRHHITHGFLAAISSQQALFIFALGSVIPLSYFIGMAVASISAQSSIGMGAVINATFGSIVEIILYCIALTQDKARLVEGSIVGSILAGVLLMPGISMCSGAMRRKEQRFNARSAGVTSTMLIMAIIGILTPTLFYQIYGTFQLTCKGCPKGGMPGDMWTCKRCYYEHIPPATDPFYQTNVKGLMYTCTVVLVLSYCVGLWFSLRTHASQIWQNAQPAPAHHHHHAAVGMPATVTTAPQAISIPSAQRASIYKRLLPTSVVQQLLPTHRPNSQAHSAGGSQGYETIRSSSKPGMTGAGALHDEPPPLELPEGLSADDYARAVALTASAFVQHHHQQQQQQQAQAAAEHHQDAHTHATQRPPRQRPSSQHVNQAMPRMEAPRHVSVLEAEDSDGAGGHDAPSWTRTTSLVVLFSCTILYAIIAEILVDAVDVVLEGSGIDLKLLGVTLFALVPNATEFMNAMSFAINGNIGLSIEIGSAYALQVCLLQVPAVVVFSAMYNVHSGEIDPHRIFSLIWPRWDTIAIIFSVFLLTYVYIESRANYYRGSILILSYIVLISGFVFAPSTGDSEAPGDDGVGGSRFTSFATLGGAFGASPTTCSKGDPQTAMAAMAQHPALVPVLSFAQWLVALAGSLWAR